MQRHDLGQRLALQQDIVAVGGADRQADDEILAAGAADVLDDGARQAGAVFQAAAPAVVAPVRPRGPELVEQRMVGGPDLDALKAGLAAADRRGGMGGDDLLDLRLGHGVGAVAVVVRGPAGRAPVGVEREVGIAVLADRVELLQDHRAGRFHRFGDRPEMGDDVVGAGAEVAAGQHGGGVDRHRLGDDHRRPAQRAFQQIGAEARARQAALGHVRGMGAEDHAVAQLVAAHRQRRHQAGMGGHGGLRAEMSDATAGGREAQSPGATSPRRNATGAAERPMLGKAHRGHAGGRSHRARCGPWLPRLENKSRRAAGPAPVRALGRARALRYAGAADRWCRCSACGRRWRSTAPPPPGSISAPTAGRFLPAWMKATIRRRTPGIGRRC